MAPKAPIRYDDLVSITIDAELDPQDCGEILVVLPGAVNMPLPVHGVEINDARQIILTLSDEPL